MTFYDNQKIYYNNTLAILHQCFYPKCLVL